QTGADDVLPRRLAAARDRHDVVEGELRGGELLSAVLAAVAVAQIDVAARELHFLPRQPVEYQELNDMRNQDVTAGRADEMILVNLHRNISPVLEIVRAVLGVDSLDLAFVQKGQRATRRSDLHRLENPVEYEHVTVEHKLPLVTPHNAEVVSISRSFERVGTFYTPAVRWLLGC